MSEWISVDDQIPPKREADEDCTVDVLAWTESRNMLAALYIFSDAEWYDLDGEMIQGVTHWQPLLTPPQ